MSSEDNTSSNPGSAAAPADASVIEELVTANHILYNQRVLDAFGHVSVRHPDDPERFLMCRNMAPALVRAQDIVTFALDGSPVDAQGRGVYLERFIHGQVYRARPDVMAVVHSHSPAIVPFSIVKSAPLRPVCHMAGFLGRSTPIFEIRDEVGDGSNLLITNNALGQALAKSLGERPLVLMRGHGSTVVADNLQKAVYRAVYAEINARTQLEASRLGPIEFLTEAEADATSATNESQIGRAWNLWKTLAAQNPVSQPGQ